MNGPFGFCGLRSQQALPARQCGPQLGFCNVRRQRLGGAAGFRIGQGFLRGPSSKPAFGKALGRGLGQADAGDRVIAIAGVHPLADPGKLHFQHRRMGAGRQQGQRGAETAARMGDLDRAGLAGRLRTDDLGPVGQQPRHGKAPAFGGFADRGGDKARGLPEAARSAGGL